MNTFTKRPPVLFLIVLSIALTGSAQVKTRRIEQPDRFVYPNTPIQVSFCLDGKALSGRELEGGSDWLNRLSLDVTNASDKTIKSLLINLVIKEPIYGARVATPETAGIVITVELRHSAIKILPAGDRITLKPPAPVVDYWTKYAREQGIEDIEKVILDIREVGFIDDTGWSMGRRTRKDPETGRSLFVIEDRGPPALSLPTSSLTPNRPRFFFF